MKLSLKRQMMAMALLASVAASPLMALAATFNDTQGNWAASAIEQLSTQGIIGGYPGGEFRPENPITRAEFSSVLTKALNLRTNASASAFTDVPTSHWAAPSIEAVRASGLVSGYPGQLFMPTKNISRAEAASVIVNGSKMALVSESEADQILGRYSDASQVPTWARRHVATAVKNRLFAMDPSDNNQLNAMSAATRADVAAMTQNLRVALNLNNTMASQSGNPNQMANNNSQMNNAPNAMVNGSTFQSGVSLVPAQTKFTATLSGNLDSSTSKPGDQVLLTLDKALTNANGQVVVPQGATIRGKVAEVEPSGRAGKSGMLDLDLDELVLPDGQRVTLKAQVATEDGILRGDTTKGRILKTAGATAVGAGLGAALGTALGPLSGGKVGKGAVYGTAVGGALGATAAVARKGKEVDLRTGDKIEIQLTDALSIQQPAQSY